MYRIPLLEDETLTSFCSRLAAANVQSAPDFCLDMGFRFADVVKGEDSAIEKLSRVSHVPLDRLRASAIRRATVKFWSVGSETILNRFFVRTGLRICPLCFAEDERSTDRMPGTRRYMRRAWHLQFVRTCCHHDCALNDFGRSPLYAVRMHDLVESLSTADIDPGFGTVMYRSFTAFERYAIDRLDGVRRHGALLDEMSLQRGGYLCQILGTALLFGNEADQDSLDDDQLWRAGAEGYNYLVRGIDGLHDALDVFHARVKLTKSDFGGGKLYGRFYKILWDHKVAEWSVVKRAIHDYAFEVLPLSRSADVFGRSEVVRYLSEKELRRAFGTRPSHLRKFAVALGYLEHSSKLSGAMPVKAAYAAHEFMMDAVSRTEAAALVGLSYPKFAVFKAAGIIVPSLVGNRQAKLADRYSRKGLRALIDSIRPSGSKPVTDKLLGLNAAAKVCCFSSDKIVRLLQSKTLKNVAWDSSRVGFDAILVDPEEIQLQYHSPASSDLSLGQADEVLGISREALTELCKTHRLPSYMGRNRQNQLSRYIAAADVERFHRQYTTLRGAARRHGVPMKRINLAVAQAHLQPAIPAGERFAPFYLDAEITSALTSLQS